jgi:hypothetical protein
MCEGRHLACLAAQALPSMAVQPLHGVDEQLTCRPPQLCSAWRLVLAGPSPRALHTQLAAACCMRMHVRVLMQLRVSRAAGRRARSGGLLLEHAVEVGADAQQQTDEDDIHAEVPARPHLHARAWCVMRCVEVGATSADWEGDGFVATTDTMQCRVSS